MSRVCNKMVIAFAIVTLFCMNGCNKKTYLFLKEVDSLALANVQMHLEKAYKNFFRDPKIGFPKFKSKHRSRKSYTTNVVNGNIQVEDHRIKLPKLKWISVKNAVNVEI